MTAPSECYREVAPGELCGGALARLTTRGRFYPYRKGVEYEIPEDLPTLTCTVCGESYMTDSEAAEIEKRFLDTAPGDLTACPYCKTDLVESVIPEKYRRHFGGATHGGRVLIVYDRSVEAVVDRQCPDCGKSLEGNPWKFPKS